MLARSIDMTQNFDLRQSRVTCRLNSTRFTGAVSASLSKLGEYHDHNL
jgi:hypothetical protein